MSSLDDLRRAVVEANAAIAGSGLVIQAFGNASGCLREEGLVAIKPSGVACHALAPDEVVITDLDGKVVEGRLRPSSDLPTHLALYRAFPSIGGVVHTHSRFATAWAQAGREIPCLGTTHADYFRGAVPLTLPMEPPEIESDYEWNTGQAIVRRFAHLDPAEFPAVLVHGHGPFCWGKTPADAATHADILEAIAGAAWLTMTLHPGVGPIADTLRDKHFLRKHGPNAYYGQK
jgi:L-ribulose-5-phosphate 4-epimerase